MDNDLTATAQLPMFCARCHAQFTMADLCYGHDCGAIPRARPDDLDLDVTWDDDITVVQAHADVVSYVGWTDAAIAADIERAVRA